MLGAKVSNEKKNSISRRLVLFEGSHGNEYFGILTKAIGTKELFKYLNEKLNKLDFRAEIVFYPKLNPDGINFERRFTSLGRDINRDFADDLLTNQEASLLATSLNSIFDNYSGDSLGVDYHCCGNKLLPNKLVDASMVKKSVNAARHSIDSAIDTSSASELFGQEFVGTLKSYMSDKYSVPSFTFELPNEEISHEKVKQHIDWWIKLLSQVLN